MKRRAAVLAWVVAAATACGVTAESSPTFSDDDSVPFQLLEDAPPTTSPPTTILTAASDICLARGATLVPARRPVERASDAASVLATLADGPTRDERRAGLRSPLFAEGLVAGVSARSGVVTVDLAPAFTQGGAGDQLLAIAGIVCSLTAQPGTGQVVFTLAGAAIDVPRGDGSLVSGPVSREDYAALVGPRLGL
ncbi:MAG TPA: GerMN domain-containing protein [Acidimicrobiales bacterium]|nr:GerMN domain-containing protein [Acidimicrobiales bacterium]